MAGWHASATSLSLFGAIAYFWTAAPTHHTHATQGFIVNLEKTEEVGEEVRKVSPSFSGKAGVGGESWALGTPDCSFKHFTSARSPVFVLALVSQQREREQELVKGATTGSGFYSFIMSNSHP